MIIRNLDSNGDWRFGKGKNDFVQENQAIALNIKTRLMSWVGDCFFETSAGIDWINRIGNKNQQENLEQELRTLIIKSEGVSELVSFNSIVENRVFTGYYTIKTIYGGVIEETINEVL